MRHCYAAAVSWRRPAEQRHCLASMATRFRCMGLLLTVILGMYSL